MESNGDDEGTFPGGARCLRLHWYGAVGRGADSGGCRPAVLVAPTFIGSTTRRRPRRGGGIARVRFRVFGGADVWPVQCVGGRQDADSTATGWAESFDSAAGARQAALSECGSRGGSGCTVQVWGCNGPVVEEGLGPNQAARRQVQHDLRAEGFDPGGADGLFGPRTRFGDSELAVGARGYRRPDVRTARRSKRYAAGADRGLQHLQALRLRVPRGTGEVVFWQSIQNSTNRVEFEACLRAVPEWVVPRAGAGPAGGVCGSTSDPITAAEQALADPCRRLPERGPQERVPRYPKRLRTPMHSAQRARWFRPDQTCADQTGASCWMEISQRPGCYVWNPCPATDETVIWTRACAGSFAQGPRDAHDSSLTDVRTSGDLFGNPQRVP